METFRAFVSTKSLATVSSCRGGLIRMIMFHAISPRARRLYKRRSDIPEGDCPGFFVR